MSRSEHAAERFRSGLNCAEAVLGEYAEEYGVDEAAAMRLICGFGGGMGRTGGTCGAVTGAIAVIGLMTCGADPRDPLAKARVYSLVHEFVERFEAKHGISTCPGLLGCDIGTPDGYAQAQRQGLLDTRCPGYVEDAVEIIEDMFG